MFSILEQFKAKNINFTAISTKPLDSSRGPYNAFSTGSQSFNTDTPPTYWQVSFPQKVTATSYQFGGASNWNWYTTEWEVSYSNNNKTFVPVQTDSRSSPGTTHTFPIYPPIECKHFRITAKKSTNGIRLNFNKFDLFGIAGTAKVRRRNTCNNRLIKAQLISNILIMTMQSRVTY